VNDLCKSDLPCPEKLAGFPFSFSLLFAAKRRMPCPVSLNVAAGAMLERGARRGVVGGTVHATPSVCQGHRSPVLRSGFAAGCGQVMDGVQPGLGRAVGH